MLLNKVLHTAQIKVKNEIQLSLWTKEEKNIQQRVFHHARSSRKGQYSIEDKNEQGIERKQAF